MAEPKFDPCWLYGPNREAVELFTQADYDRYAAMGWQGSPAVFGIETHPQHPVQAVQVTSLGEPLTPGVPLTQLQAQVTQVEGDVVSLQAMLESVMNRLAVLEDLMTQPPARTSQPEPKPAEDDDKSPSARRSAPSAEAASTHDDPAGSAGRRRP